MFDETIKHVFCNTTYAFCFQSFDGLFYRTDARLHMIVVDIVSYIERDDLHALQVRFEFGVTGAGNIACRLIASSEIYSQIWAKWTQKTVDKVVLSWVLYGCKVREAGIIRIVRKYRVVVKQLRVAISTHILRFSLMDKWVDEGLFTLDSSPNRVFNLKHARIGFDKIALRCYQSETYQSLRFA